MASAFPGARLVRCSSQRQVSQVCSRKKSMVAVRSSSSRSATDFQLRMSSNSTKRLASAHRRHPQQSESPIAVLVLQGNATQTAAAHSSDPTQKPYACMLRACHMGSCLQPAWQSKREELPCST